MEQDKKPFNTKVLVLIVLALVVGALVMYFLMKDNTSSVRNMNESSFDANLNETDGVNENTQISQDLSVVEKNKQDAINNPIVSNFNCPTNFKKSLQVIYPNGNESYYLGDIIHVEFESCVSMPTVASFNGAGILRYDLAGNYPSVGTRIEIINPNNYLTNYQQQQLENKYKISFDIQIPNNGYMNATLPTATSVYVGDPNIKYKLYLEGVFSEDYYSADSSDGYFTIKAKSGFVEALPKYVGTHNDCGNSLKCWPPTVTNSSKAYVCNNIGVAPNTEGNDVTVERIINGRTYCINSISGGYTGGVGYKYTYITSNGTGTKIINFGLLFPNCANYGDSKDSKVVQCNSSQSTFKENLDIFIDSYFTVKAQNSSVLTKSQAEVLVHQKWSDCSKGDCSDVAVSVTKDNKGQYVVTAIFTELDDSVSQTKKVSIAILNNGVWVLGEPTVTRTCHRGNSDGTTGWTAGLCI